MSYLEVPPYIALAHELEHVLNRLELFEQSMSRDVFINGCKQGLKELQKTSLSLCSIDALIINGFINNEDIVMEKTSVSSYLEFIGYIMQKKIKNAIDKQFLLNAIIRRDVSFFLAKRIPIEEQLVKDSFKNLDELSVILGSFHETTLGPCFLGETIFMREHYKAINEQLHFWCWSHSLIKKPSLGPWSPNSEVKFDHNLACDVLSSLNLIKIETKKQKSIKLEIEKAFLVTNFNDIGDIILVESEEKQYNLHDLFKFLNIKEITEKTLSKELQKPLNKNITVTIDKSDWAAQSGNISTFTLANAKIAQKLFFCTNPYDRKIYSENLHIKSISLPLNIEKLVDKGSVFSIPKGVKVEAGKSIDLFFKPFEPEIENEIVIEGARIQLRNVAADGNCGVWALLQALYPEQKFIRPTYFQKQDMQRFRAKAANYVPPLKLPQAQNPTGLRISMSAFCSSDLDHWLYTDDFRYFAQALGRPIGIIVYGDGYRIYEPNANEPNGNEIVYNNINDFRAYLKQHSGMPILCLAGNHYQAVINIKDLSLSTWLQK